MSERGKPIRVVIADDHPIVRTGLRLMLETGEGIELVGEAADGASAIQQVGELQPDVVLMDIRMPGIDGLTAIERIHHEWSHIGILILTTYTGDDLLIRGLQAGAQGYLIKDTDLDVLLDAIRVVARGEMHMPPEMMKRVLSHAARSVSSPAAARAFKHPPLTERERDILAGVARGERTKEIAARLSITARTVGATLTNIYAKLGVDSRASAIAVAMERHLLPNQSEYEEGENGDE